VVLRPLLQALAAAFPRLLARASPSSGA
jgi:hypothetical protein